MGSQEKQLNDMLEKIAKETQTVSLSAAALFKDEVIWTYAFGYSDKGNKIIATTKTVYRIASASKQIACLVMMTLVDSGKLNLDEDISVYLGYKVRNPYYKDIPITCRQLMTHTSTIIEHASYNKILSGDLPPYQLSEILPEHAKGYSEKNFLNAEPGKGYCYSSFGTGILGAIAECITGKKFAVYAREKIFKPLGLDASFDLADISETSDIAVSYEVGGPQNAETTEWLKKSLANKKKLYDLPIGQAYRIPQGNVYIRAQDLACLMQVFLNDGAVNGKRIISEKSIAEMTKKQFSDKNRTSGLGLFHLDYLEKGMMGHFGRAYGAFSFTAFNIKEKKAAVVLMNGTDPKQDEHGNNSTCTRALLEIYHMMDRIIIT